MSESYHQVQVKLITNTIGKDKGKANVLAHLAQEAKGEYLLITDADITVNVGWAKNMIAHAQQKNADIITGVTLISGKKLIHRMQNIDWIYSLGMVKVLSDLQLPVTTMGNNMLIKREAYFKTGGYEKIPFSVTEDFALFQKVIENQGVFFNGYTKEVLAYSKPIETFKQLIHQRKRWMNGAFQAPWYMVLCLVLQALYYPLALAGAFFNYKMILALVFGKCIVQVIFISLNAKKVNVKIRHLDLLCYDVYSMFLSFTLLIYYFIPTGVKWKGRTY